MSLAACGAGVREEQHWGQVEETWGHLRPKPGDHPGYMVAAHSEYSDPRVTIVQEAFEGVPNSPWFYENMNLFACKSMRRGRARGIWEFRGVLRVCQNGKFRFIGKWTKMDLYPGRIPATKPRRHWGYWPYINKKAIPEMRESDTDYVEGNLSAAVRFLDTMNKRRHGRDGMEPKSKKEKA